jgi:ribosomal-protein-alanine N-acetyltransferase
MDIEPVAFGSHHWSRDSFLNELANPSGFYFVAFNSEMLLGYSGFWLIGDEAHITTLAVHPDCRRAYIGERLLINDIEHAESVGAKRLTLEVRLSNEAAQRLYEKYGFKELGKRRKYYQDNDEDALVLWADITEELKSLLILESQKHAAPRKAKNLS